MGVVLIKPGGDVMVTVVVVGPCATRAPAHGPPVVAAPALPYLCRAQSVGSAWQ